MTELPGLEKYISLPVFGIIAKAAANLHTEAYVIGGYVRDVLLHRPCKDIDIVTPGNGIELAHETARLLKIRKVAVYKNFGTAMFNYGDLQIEFVGARKESYRSESRNPEVTAGTLEDDQNRRDFTINTLAISLMAESYCQLIDPFHGLIDLENGIIRTPLDADITFADDPLRMMRAVRFATQLNFDIDGSTFDAISRNRERISIISAERIGDEINKIVMAEKPSKGFYLLDKAGLLEIIFPKFITLKGAEYIEGRGHKDNFRHTLEVLDRIAPNTNNLWLRWAALLHDIGKPVTKRYDQVLGWTFHGHDFKGMKMIPAIFEQFRFPLNEKLKYVQKMVQLHLRPIVLADEGVTDSAVRRLLFDAGDDIDDLMTLCEADITSKNPEKVKRYMRNFVLVRQKLQEIEEKDHLRNWQPPVTGEIIMATFGLQPCREVGVIKTAIREAILEGELSNNFEDAYARMIAEGQKIGLQVVKSEMPSGEQKSSSSTSEIPQ